MSDEKKGPQNVLRTLPNMPGPRKTIPITTGVLDYFPLAVAEIAKVSKAGNDQHNPGQPLHWNRGKSSDHADCVTRHLIERGTMDTDGMRHSAKAAWRMLALLQEELEAEAGFDPSASAVVIAIDSRPNLEKFPLERFAKDCVTQDTGNGPFIRRNAIPVLPGDNR